jgi:hypothetical protein
MNTGCIRIGSDTQKFTFHYFQFEIPKKVPKGEAAWAEIVNFAMDMMESAARLTSRQNHSPFQVFC